MPKLAAGHPDVPVQVYEQTPTQEGTPPNAAFRVQIPVVKPLAVTKLVVTPTPQVTAATTLPADHGVDPAAQDGEHTAPTGVAAQRPELAQTNVLDVTTVVLLTTTIDVDTLTVTTVPVEVTAKTWVDVEVGTLGTKT